MTIRVLLVDDEEEFIETLAQRLQIRDFEITTACNGKEALDRLEDLDVDLVVLDVQMPGMGGVEILQKIKELKPLVEVILLTGHATVETAIQGMKLGAFDYLIKPAETEDLVDKIQKAHVRKAEQEERIRKAEINGIVKRRGW